MCEINCLYTDDAETWIIIIMFAANTNCNRDTQNHYMDINKSQEFNQIESSMLPLVRQLLDQSRRDVITSSVTDHSYRTTS